MVDNRTEIDSLKLRFPFEEIEIISSEIDQTYITYNASTGEEIDNFKNVAHKVIEKGITTRFAIEVQPTDNKTGAKEKYLVILLNSKTLKNNYFEGITRANIEEVYNYLISLEIASFTIENLLKAECTDIDFKTDYYLTMQSFMESLDFLKRNSKESKASEKGYKGFNEKTNKGLQWSTRKTTAFKTNPYIKIYHKELELKFKSREFCNEFVDRKRIKDLVRTEFTIKNKKHLKALGIENNSFETLLNLEDSFKKTLIEKTLNVHLSKRKISKKETPKGMNPTEQMFYKLITMQMKLDFTYEKIRSIVLEDMNKDNRYKKGLYLDAIYHTYIEGKTEDKNTKEVDGFFGILGLNK